MSSLKQRIYGLFGKNKSEDNKKPPTDVQLEAPNTSSPATVTDDDDDFVEENLRGNWSNHTEFILSIVGYAVGLGNVWRFPYQCYKNGGGAFLVVYWMLSTSVAFPIVFLEQSIGQFTSQGPMHCWMYSPIIRGIGFSMVTLTSLGCIYYNVIIAWALFMMFASFQSELPWKSCDFDSWADYRCELGSMPCNSSLPYEIPGTDGLCYNASQIEIHHDVTTQTSRYFNFTTCPNSTTLVDDLCLNFYSREAGQLFRNTSSVLGFWNESLAIENDVSPQLTTDQYFNHYVLGMYDHHSVENLGTPRWGLVLSLLLAWIIVFACLLNGIHSSGKVVYFTALFPYVILFILIGRGATLPGAYDGLMFYLKPDWEKVKQPTVWFAAANQLCYSMACAWGGMIALSSYNKFHNNVLRDAVIAVFADCMTSFTAGFAVFSIIGYGSYVLKQPVDKVAAAGTGLAFIMYPKVVMELPGSVVWAIAFFFMILLLGLDSQFNMMETVITALLDEMPQFRKNIKRKAAFCAVICVIFFLLGLPMVCNAGSQLITVVDEYSSGWGALIVAVIELLSMGWIYGTGNYHNDMKIMIGTPWRDFGRYYLFVMWRVVSPGLVCFILIYSWINYTPGDKSVTDQAIGSCCALYVLVWPPFFAVYEFVKAKGSFLKRMKQICSPTREWGPYFVKDRRLVKHLGPDFVVDPRNVLKNRRKKIAEVADQQVPGSSSTHDNPGYQVDSSDLPPSYTSL